jgi:hypothetical protein
MSILLIEGFDVYPNINSTSYGLQSRWLSTSAYNRISLVTGRYGGQALQITGATNNFGASADYPLTAAGSGTTTLTLGVAYNNGLSIPGNVVVLNFQNGGAGGTQICGLAMNSSQQLFFWRGTTATVLATSSVSIPTGSWHYLEVVLTIATSGSFSVYLDGVSIMSATAVNTGSLSIDTLELGTNTGYFVSEIGYFSQFDDLYVTNTAVRVGERRVATLYPASNGAVAWTPLTGTNYSEVNSTLCNGGASYVSTSTASASDLYGITSLPTTPAVIDAVQTRVCVSKSDAGTHTVKGQIKSGATLAQGAVYGVSSSFLYDIDIYPTDPNTGGAWAGSAVNAAQIGQELIS